MKVRQLIKILEELDQDAVINIASDEEGNGFGDISKDIAGGTLIATHQQVYSLYPLNLRLPEEIFEYE
ncbi:MAG: hypothetical protein A2561_01300 [Candidatus Staskawiczbacteria bacterium RIFOXYD1_FULL_32_13]|uniref:Uncharacterized protein n=1 Tax=Candidatus Staskawiczbacteria bacterium RIFOXYD1_FULL_32_13 TaxID=1802234 RepID=A0A1G2JPZ0_9BACT|nr:MAG: hypothetical protein A2256_00290 [Candidatus Staskawiczbacteria bacterium RIFOXYA2_FULL_32_7]OGZ89205.1 MAG: hypothetical protein A2561_01300 [Candidatus Staskawiczbacteria bacterium RIFOXYD1_FULL_32_13]